MTLDRDEMQEVVGGKASKALTDSQGGGGAVIGFMTDAYINHGWLSVYITVQSAFIPQTVVGIALGCIAVDW